jgi:hypothetical protein
MTNTAGAQKQPTRKELRAPATAARPVAGGELVRGNWFTTSGTVSGR